jgi:hypothetical protein
MRWNIRRNDRQNELQSSKCEERENDLHIAEPDHYWNILLEYLPVSYMNLKDK